MGGLIVWKGGCWGVDAHLARLLGSVRLGRFGAPAASCCFGAWEGRFGGAVGTAGTSRAEAACPLPRLPPRPLPPTQTHKPRPQEQNRKARQAGDDKQLKQAASRRKKARLGGLARFGPAARGLPRKEPFGSGAPPPK